MQPDTWANPVIMLTTEDRPADAWQGTNSWEKFGQVGITEEAEVSRA